VAPLKACSGIFFGQNSKQKISFKRMEIKKIQSGPVLKAQVSKLRQTHTDVELRTK
jgi:hypothetical protein